MKKSIYFILVACCWAGYLQAQSVQPGDCTGAINLYGNFNYPVMAYPANTVPNEINPATSCLSNGEENGIWFEFLVLDTGVLSFNLIPSNPTDDYDWALFNITGLACSNIYTDTLEVRCNFNNSVTNGGITGANGGSNNQDEPTLNVFPGEWFKLFLSNYGMTSGGFYLDFSASTFGFDGTIGIDESSEPMLANVGPNPSDGFFNLNLNSTPLHQITSLQVVDLNGKIVWKHAGDLHPTHSIDLRSEPSGVYFLYVSGQTGTQVIKLVVL